MPSCPFVHQSLQSKGQKVPKSGAFKNEGIPETTLFSGQSKDPDFDIIVGVSTLRQRLTSVRLPHSYLTQSYPRLLTTTFTTTDFGCSSSWQFGTSSC